MTYTRPLRRTILQPSQIRRTLDRIFMASFPSTVKRTTRRATSNLPGSGGSEIVENTHAGPQVTGEQQLI